MWSRVGCVLVVVLGACGRVNFDEIEPGSVPIGGVCEVDLQCPLCARCDASLCVREPINDLFVGHRHMCYLGANGSRWCAGENEQGGLSLGIANVPTIYRPTRIVGDDGWTDLFLGWRGGAGIKNGRLFDLFSVPSEANNSDISNLEEMQFEAFGGCTVHKDGTLSCDPTSATWMAFDQGSNAQCGIKSDGTLWCWGRSAGNALGLGVIPDETTFDEPQQVGTDGDWRDVSTGTMISCAIRASGNLYCWGIPLLTGTNGVDTLGVPMQVGTDADWISVQTHWNRTCGEKSDGRFFCWGNDGGPIVPGLRSVAVPTELSGGPYDRLVVGGHAACARKLDGRWGCIGENTTYGMLGIGTNAQPEGFVDLCPAE